MHVSLFPVQPGQRLVRWLILLFLVAAVFSGTRSSLAAGSISLTTSGVAYTEDFNTLASSGTSSVVPNGWDFFETGTNANTTYTAGNGSGIAGDTYSFGSTGSTERAFGGLRSGTLVPMIGAQFTNNTGGVITSLDISYTGEQWRLGQNTTGRSADRLDFQLSTNATSISTGNWTDYDALDFSSPVVAGTVGAINGNLPANRTPLSFTITGLNIPNGASFWIRWADSDLIPGADDGLAVDDFFLTPNTTVIPTDPTGVGAANPDPVTAGGSTLLTVNVTPGTNPTSTGLAVTADLTSIGGSATQTFFDNGTNGDVTAGDNVFSFLATVPGATASGAKSLPVTITDAQARSGSTTIALTVQAVPAPVLVVVSQVYGGGGNSGAIYTHDFIELYNRGTTAVSLAGWSVQYASSTGTGNWSVTALSGNIQPGKYYLVQQAAGTGGTAPLPTPDAIGTIGMSATAGKVALVNTTTALNGACPTGSQIVDLVGYGSANCFEGSAAAPTLSNTTAALRAGDGAIDTNDNANDFVAGPPNPRNSSFVDPAPFVASTNPANGEPNVALNADIIVTFSEAVHVSGNWFTISCSDSGPVTATVSGGPITFTLNPDVDFLSGETCTVTVLASQVTDQDLNDPPDNMVADYSWSFAVTDVCLLGYTPIYEIQGSGTASPISGSTVSTQGVVTGDFQGTTGLNGFFVQDATGDDDPLTSDGIFIFVPSSNPLASIDVAAGDLVRITGRVTEFNTLTELDLVSAISICGAATPISPTAVSLPEAINGDLERYEGMLITFPQTLTVSQNFFQGRFGQVTLSANGRLFNPTHLFAPGSAAAIAQADENARRVLILDDGTSSQNPNPIPYIGADNTLRAGDTVAGLTGVLDFGLITSDSVTRDYRLQPTAPPTFNRVNERTAAPAPVGGNLKVAAFNVLNYFNGNGLGGGFPTSRGASSLVEFNRQRDKIIAAITAMDADIIGLMELENDAPPHSAIEDLVSGLNAATAPGTYAFINTGIIGTDEIRVGLIYKPALVSPVGAHAVLTSAVDPRFNDARNRPVLAQTFTLNSTGARLTVAVNHFKSKGSSCASDGDPDLGDGQGNCNLTRTNAASALTNWLAMDPTGSGDPDFLIIGDLNAYAQEDPITAIRDAGYTNLIETFMGGSAYSFTFNGESGYLDHALATASLHDQVSGVTEWHINADEPSVLDYNTEFKPQDLYSPTAYRSADHDPVIVGLNLNAPPTVSAGGPYSVGEGGSVTVAATGNDPDGNSLTYAWDLDNNGSFETSGQSVTFSAAALDGPSSATVSVKVTDSGGLTAVSQATITINNVAPSVATLTISPSPSTLGSSVTAAATFTDPAPNDAPFSCTVNYGDGSGAQAGTISGGSCTGPSHTYAAVGAYTVTLAVTDKDGGTGVKTTVHNVIFQFTGFLAPVDNLPVLNEVTAGSAIPVRFSLNGDQGLAIIAIGYPVSVGIACDTSAPISGVEETVTPGSSTLSYDPVTDQYTYVWKTSRAWRDTCRQLVVRLSDGTEHVANFKFRR